MNSYTTVKEIKLEPQFFLVNRPKLNMIYGAGILIGYMADMLYRIYEDPDTYKFITKERPDT